jgi:hypothetical protein
VQGPEFSPQHWEKKKKKNWQETNPEKHDKFRKINLETCRYEK